MLNYRESAWPIACLPGLLHIAQENIHADFKQQSAPGVVAGVVPDQDQAQGPVPELLREAPGLGPLHVCRRRNSRNINSCCGAGLLTSITAHITAVFITCISDRHRLHRCRCKQ